MVRRAVVAFVLLFVALTWGCGGKDPGEPSFPRSAATVGSAPAPPAKETAARVVPAPLVTKLPGGPGPGDPAEPLHPGGEVSEPVAIVRVLPDCRILVGAAMPIAVEVVVTREGTVSSARVLSAATESVQGIVLQHVRGWRFRPATLHGRAVSVSITVSVNCA